MANFNTHLAVASVGSGLCATVALAGHAAPNNYLLTLTLAGTIGGILPDIDLEKAIPARMLFSVLGVVTAFIALVHTERAAFDCRTLDRVAWRLFHHAIWRL